MPKIRRKADLPVKDCAACGKPMVWRKRWRNTWDDVRYCSARCQTSTTPEPKERRT